MLFSLKRIGQAAVLGLGMVGASAHQADAGLILSYEAVGVQASTVAGVTTETFDSISTGQFTSLETNVGTLTAVTPGLAIVGANVFGGAGGTGNYFAVGSQSGTSTVNLALNGAQGYFGFWWSAADRFNAIDFYSAGNLLGRFSTETAMTALGNSFNGNPNTNFTGNTGEKYAYLNIIGTDGTTIDQVVFTNSLVTGFEADNFSVRSAPLTSIPGTIINDGIASVPEPSSLAMVSIGGLLGCGTWLRGRRRSAVGA